jgi:hypothetical protein
MRSANVFGHVAVAALACVLPGLLPLSLAEPVSVDEAVATAALWLEQEVAGPHSRLTALERADWITRLDTPDVLYVLANDVWVDTPPRSDPVLAYIVAYAPGGFAVLLADDRLAPLAVFDAYSPFRPDPVPENFLRKYLARDVPARWAHLQARLETEAVDVHPDWTWLRQQRAARDSGDPEDPRGDRTYMLLDTAPWGQGWPYNTEVTLHNGGSSCPTGCTATAMAIQMRFHAWPPTGSGTHAYCDEQGDIQYCHAVSFGGTTYDWANMPDWDFGTENFPVAQLTYHCGVAVEMDYELNVSCAWPSAAAMNAHFRYRGTEELWSAAPSDHVEGMSGSILAGLPVVLSTFDHTVVACGYRDTSPDDRWYLNVGWYGNNNGWYDLHEIPGGDDHLIQLSLPHSSPNNFVFVDGGWSGPETGSHHFPYNTVTEGNAAVPAGGRLRIKGGNYAGAGNVPVTLSTPMTVTIYEGTVTIGGP